MTWLQGTLVLPCLWTMMLIQAKLNRYIQGRVIFCLCANWPDMLFHCTNKILLSYNWCVIHLCQHCALSMSGVGNSDDGEGHYIFTPGGHILSRIADLQASNFDFKLISFIQYRGLWLKWTVHIFVSSMFTLTEIHLTV